MERKITLMSVLGYQCNTRLEAPSRWVQTIGGINSDIIHCAFDYQSGLDIGEICGFRLQDFSVQLCCLLCSMARDINPVHHANDDIWGNTRMGERLSIYSVIHNSSACLLHNT